MGLRTGNPALKADTFTNYITNLNEGSSSEAMTLNGVVHRTALLLLFVVGTAGVTWKLALTEKMGLVLYLMLGGMIGSTILAFITIAKKELAPKTSIAYALCEGLTLGGISAFFELRYPGVVMQAVSATFGTLLCLLAAYRSGMIKATENFKLGVVAATGGILVTYIFALIMSLFGVSILGGGGLIQIGISLFVVAIAALNLVLDFDFIESGVETQAPKYMEWYAAFGLMLTLIWLYLELLRLFANMRERR